MTIGIAGISCCRAASSAPGSIHRGHTAFRRHHVGSRISLAITCGITAAVISTASGQDALTPAQQQAQADSGVRALVSRLDLERYKATVKGLTQFGDRRQGTDRNRAAVDWIEAQLKSYGCTNTDRIK